MKLSLKFLAIFALTFALTGCAALSNFAQDDRLSQIKLGLDVVVLDQDFQEAAEALLSNDWGDVEREQVLEHIAGLQSLRDTLRDLANVKQSGVEVLVDPNVTFDVLNSIADHYNGLRDLYGNYLNRTGIPVDPRLREYSQRAVMVWIQIVRYLHGPDGSNGIPADDLQSLITYLARGYIMYKTGVVL